MPPRFAVILPAAGSASRFGADKLSVRVAGRSVLEHAAAAFTGRDDVGLVLVATGRTELLNALPAHPKLQRCDGGDCRAATVAASMDHLQRLNLDLPYIAVHDAARPAVSADLIDRVFAAAVEHGAAVPGVWVTDTIKQVAGPQVAKTLRRAELIAVQTPQAMRRDWLADALARCPLPLAEITDDVQLLELVGHPVHWVDGDSANRKLTRPDDLEWLERRLSSTTLAP